MFFNIFKRNKDKVPLNLVYENHRCIPCNLSDVKIEDKEKLELELEIVGYRYENALLNNNKILEKIYTKELLDIDSKLFKIKELQEIKKEK